MKNQFAKRKRSGIFNIKTEGVGRFYVPEREPMKVKISILLMIMAMLAVVFLATIPASAGSGGYVCNEGAGQDYIYAGRDSKNRDIARCFNIVDGTQIWRIVCSKGVVEVWAGTTVTASCAK
jgi:hypothetical protein